MAVRTREESSHVDDPAQWVDRYGDLMLSFAVARTGRREVAEDLVQEAFLAAWRARATFDGRSSRGTWLVGILRRKIADHFRASGRELVSHAAEPAMAERALFNARGKWAAAPRKWPATPERLAEDAEFWRVFGGCLDTLPVHLAQAFQLREFGLATMEDICRVAGITPKNLSVRLHRARLLLRQCLERKWFCHDKTDG